MRRDFQSRLGYKHDIIKRKLLDNQIELSSPLVDALRIKVIKNKDGDITNTIVKEASLISCSFPPLVNVPYRTIENNNGEYTITGLIDLIEDEAVQFYTITVPHNVYLSPEDLIIRVFLDPEIEKPIVLALRVTEQLGTFGVQMKLSNSYKTTIYTENFVPKVKAIILEMAKRRKIAGY